MSLINPNTLEPIRSQEVKFDPPICSLCLRQQCHDERFGMFIIALIGGHDPITREPLVKDGIFDDTGKLAKLLTCQQCLPKLAAFREHDDPKRLPKGPIRTLCQKIWKKKKHQKLVTH